ncbi:MAG: diaminopimelate epimerase [Candidatus Pelethousia sp.]|nr:diaminopimelate epimerase [Candidatus Pelethousia sp.]
MEFCKMHGLGNDFILVEDLERTFPEADAPALARKHCHRRTGIGADGLMLVQKGEKAPLRMRLYNNDGSLAEMCGNGIRCFARYAYDQGFCKETGFDIETDAGIKRAVISLNEKGAVCAVRIGMGKPLFGRRDVPMAGEGAICRLEPIEALGRTFIVSAVNTGVPHLVVFLENSLEEEDILLYGRALETHPAFPKKVNVNFAEVLDKDTLRVRTWERGCGRTLACGTGSCAAVVCAAEAGYTGRKARVELALGSLAIEWAQDGEIYMAGPAAYSFTGNA